MKYSLILLAGVLASAGAAAQETTSSDAGSSSGATSAATDTTTTATTADTAKAADASTDKASAEATARSLDLTVPKEKVKYRTDPSQDPPGTYYGDKSGRVAVPGSDADPTKAVADRCEGKLHGSVATGFGYASHGGNSNWQAVNLNSCKTYYDDDGNAHEIGVSISVGQEHGPGYYGRGWGGPPGGGW